MKYSYLIDKVPGVEIFCCGCNLEQGCLIIGWIQVILSAVALIGHATLLVTFNAAIIVGTDVDISIYGLVLTIISAIILIAILVLACYLLQGIYQDDMAKLEIWLQGELVLLLLYIVLLILYIIGACFAFELMIGPVIYDLIDIGLTSYWIIVVKSFYYAKTSVTAEAVTTSADGDGNPEATTDMQTA